MPPSLSAARGHRVVTDAWYPTLSESPRLSNERSFRSNERPSAAPFRLYAGFPALLSRAA